MKTPPRKRPAPVLSQEFSGLLQLDALYKARLHPHSDETHSHNRYGVLPYQDTAVTANGQYFNGSYVSLEGETPRLIATQAPVQASRDLFWVMVWQNKAAIVVMLCPPGKEADCYWPRTGQTRKVAPGLTLEHCSAEREGAFTVRKFKLTGNSGSHFVAHVEWSQWPDHGVPERLLLPQLAQLLGLVRAYYQSRECCVVHCSAGIGRTGTFLGLLHRQIAPTKCAQQIVRNLRYWRSGMVQTLEQYRMLHEWQQAGPI